MTTYPEEFKAKIIAQMLPPHNRHIPELARETGIPQDTLLWGSRSFGTRDLAGLAWTLTRKALNCLAVWSGRALILCQMFC